MEFSEDLVKVSCEAVLYKSSALTPGRAASYAMISATNTFNLHPQDGKPGGSSCPTPHTAHLLGLKPLLECHFFFFPFCEFLSGYNILSFYTHSPSIFNLNHPPHTHTHNSLYFSTGISGTAGVRPVLGLQ